jgi:hypothetical protein
LARASLDQIRLNQIRLNQIRLNQNSKEKCPQNMRAFLFCGQGVIARNELISRNDLRQLRLA